MIRVLDLQQAWRIRANVASVIYIKKKGSIVGPSFKVPFVGPFIESLCPNFDEYLGKWNSGELSCVSVFHKSVNSFRLILQ